MEKKLREGSGVFAWWNNLMIKNPRAAIAAGLSIILVVMTGVIKALYTQKDKEMKYLYGQIILAKDTCSEEKAEILSSANKRQQELNDRYMLKVEELYREIKSVNLELRKLK